MDFATFYVVGVVVVGMGFVGHVSVDKIRKFLQFFQILHRNFVQFVNL